MSSFGRGSGGTSRSGGSRAERSGPPAQARDPREAAREICLQQLAFSPRTRAELAAKLSNRGIPDDAAQEVLGRFTEVGIIDDALFAQMWVTSRHRGRGLAGRALQQELRRKGVDEDLAKEALASLEPDEERATARALVDRRIASTRGLAADARVRRLAGMLARKGYSAGVAFAVVREALAEDGAAVELEFDALAALED
ncbi:MAG: regulatory protein RecX [Mycobacteriales bacterium]